MKLTETQRKFISDKLGVTAREKKILEMRTGAQKKDDTISDALDEYLKREAKVLDSLRELEKVPGTAKMVADFEVEIAAIQSRVKKAKREDGDKTLKQAYKDLEHIKNRASKEAETATGNPKYFELLEQTQQALQALKDHPQKAHIHTQITSAEQKLAAAIKANDKRKYKDALASLTEAKKLCDDGKSYADQFNAYRIARAPAEAILANMKGQYATAATWDKFKAKVTKADASADPGKREYAKATAAVTKIRTEMSDTLKGWTKDNLQARIDELKNGVQPAFVDKDIKQLEAWRDSVDAKIAAGEWTGMDVLTTRALRFRVAATDRATRRQAYVDAKKKATDVIALLKPNTAMASKVEAFEKILKDSADPLATAEAQRFEEAIDLCKKVETDCAGLAKAADASKKYLEDKKSLETRLAALEKLPAAPHMQDAIQSLKALEAEAEKRVAAGVDDWDGGLEWLGRMGTDLMAAEELAKTMAGAVIAQEAANGAGDEEAIKKAVAQIKAEAKKAGQPPGEDLVKTELSQIATACEDALKQAGAKKLDEAKASLKKAGDLLITTQNMKGGQANFEKIQAAATKRCQELTKLAKTGTYKALKPKVELIQPMIDQAATEAKGRNFSAAAQTIGKADAAAKEAENAAEKIKAFDDRAKPLIDRQKKLKGTDASNVQKVLDNAAKKVNDLDFPEAMKLLSQAQADLETVKMKKLLKSGKDDDELLKSAKELLKQDGGPEKLDEFVSGISEDAKFGIIASLAKERFGIDLTSDEGHKTLSAKAIWAVMAAVPEKHATHSPSLKSVKRELPEDTSGAYSWFDKSMDMNGRPNNGKTEDFDAQTRHKALGLPVDHDNSKDPYAPVDATPANLFNMTVLHEVGHAVDDRLAFMVGKAGQADFGGWEQYTDLGVIADAVASNKKYDKNYVLQLMNGYNPEPAVMPDTYQGGTDAWNKAKKAVDDWFLLTSMKGGNQIWYSHSKSKQARIGDVVYQEAYSNRWVSYLLPERTKGVTAYQWRAPGEWFAELYMAWYGKKLKPNHPFAPWLKTL